MSSAGSQKRSGPRYAQAVSSSGTKEKLACVAGPTESPGVPAESRVLFSLIAKWRANAAVDVEEMIVRHLARTAHRTVGTTKMKSTDIVTNPMGS